MKPASPVKENAQEVKVLILSWPTDEQQSKYIKTNYEIAKRLSIPSGQTLNSAPRGLIRKPPRDDVPLNVTLSTFHVSRSYPALTDFARSNKIKEYDVVLILGFEHDKSTGQAIPEVVLEQVSRRKGFRTDPYGMDGEVKEEDGQFGVKGEKDFYKSPMKAEWLKAALIGRGYQAVTTRNLATDTISPGGPTEPFLCEYIYTQLLRDAEEAGGKPTVFLTHFSYLKEESESGCGGGPYTLDECVELTKCAVGYMAEQFVKEKGKTG